MQCDECRMQNEKRGRTARDGAHGCLVKIRDDLQRGGREAELERGEGLMRRARDRGRRHRLAVVGGSGQGLSSRPDLGGVGDGAAEALGEARHDAAGKARRLRAQGGRRGGDVVGAKGRRHRQYCKNLSGSARQGLGLSIGPAPRQAARSSDTIDEGLTIIRPVWLAVSQTRGFATGGPSLSHLP